MSNKLLSLFLLALVPAFAQSVSIGIGSTSALPGSTVSLPISIGSSGGAQPTAVQWSFTLPAGVTLGTVDAGPSATSAGKLISCGGNGCVVFGLNTTPIPNGTIATASFQIAANAAGTLPVSITGVVASDANSIPASGGTGTITVSAPAPVPALNALSCAAASINTPGSVSCTVTLTVGAQSGGFAVSLSSNNGSLTVPGSVTVANGQTSASFNASAVQVAADAGAIITATAGGVQRTAGVTLIAPASLSSLSCSPGSLTSGQSASCTVTLNKASAGGASVSLSDNNAVLTTPGSVAVANGASSASFNVTAGSIASNQVATVAATLNGVQRTAQVNLNAPAPAVLSSLSCAPTNFSASGTSNCTVGLASPAPSNTSVSLSDNSANVNVPSSVTVLSGQTSSGFSATVTGVPSTETVTIVASLNGGQASASLSLAPPVVPAALSSLTCSPASLLSNQSAGCTVTLDKASAGATTVTLSDNNAVLTTPGSVTISAGSSSASFNVSAGTIASNQVATVTATLNGVQRTAQVNLAAPAPAVLSSVSCAPTAFSAAGSSNCTVNLAGPAPSNTAVSLSDNSANVNVPSSVTVLSGQTTAGFTAAVTGVPVTETVAIVASLNGLQASASLSLTAPVAPAALLSLSCTPGTLNSNQSATCTVNLDKASSGIISIFLSDNNAILTTPGSVTVGNGASSESFSVTAGVVASNQAATVTAALNGVQRTAQINLAAPAPAVLSSLSCSPAAFSAAGASNCTVGLLGPAPSNALVNLSDNSANVSVPASVTVLAGQTTAGFAATVTGVPVTESVTIVANLNGLQASASLSLTAPAAPASLSSLTCAPGSLNSSQSASCTVSLDKASSGGTTVSVSSDNVLLTGPSNVTIPNGAASAAFSVTAGTIASSQTATVTVALNGTVRSAQVSLASAAAVTLSSLSCSPSAFAAAGMADCTVSLSLPVSSTTQIALSSSSPNVAVPGTVTVLAGRDAVQFTAAVSAVTNTETPSITASLGGTVRTAGLTLTAPAPVVLSSLVCAPASITSNQSATCTASLNKISANSVTLVLSGNNSILTTPPTAIVPAGASSATFVVSAGTIPSSQTASVAASWNGVTQTTQLVLEVSAGPSPESVTLSSLTCAPASVTAGSSALCVVTLSATALSTTSVGLASASDQLALPAAVDVPQGASSAQFRVNIPGSAAPQQVLLTASHGTVTQTALLTIVVSTSPAGASQLTSLACSPTRLAPGESSECTVYLKDLAGADLIANVAASTLGLVVPGTVDLLAGTKHQSFTAVASETLQSAQTVDLTVTHNGETVVTRLDLNLGVSEPPLTSFECSASSLTSAAGAVCVVTLKSGAPFASEILLSSSNATLLHLPSRAGVNAGANSVSFAIQAGAVDVEQAVTLSAAWNGKAPLTKVVQVRPHSITLQVPASEFTRAGSPVKFEVKSTHSAGFATSLSTLTLPQGAVLRGSEFTWTPIEEQVGEYAIQFRATDDSGLSGTATTRVVVRSAQPSIQGLFNPAGYTPIESCSPNAIVTFLGSGFSLHDPTEATSTPWPTELAGVRIRINGVYAPLTFVSDTTVHFQCPASAPGTTLEIVLEYESVPSFTTTFSGAAAVTSVAPVVVRMGDAIPGIYQLRGTQAAALIAGTGMVAGVPQGGIAVESYPARPVRTGEYLEIYANGLGATDATLAPGQAAPLDRLIRVTGSVALVFADGRRVPAEFAGLAPGGVGLFQINVPVPASVLIGESVPLYLELTKQDGSVLRSNTVTIAVAH